MINWKTLPRERGIYQITTGSVSYVGLSDNIQLRVKQHLESSSCRSRIILDTNKAKIIILELLPNTDDKTLALREWYWFSKLKRKGHILVNDPKTLGKTKSGQFFPPQKVTAKTTSPQQIPLGCGLKAAGVTTIVVGFFCVGFFAAGKIIQETSSDQTSSEITAEDSSEPPPVPTSRLESNPSSPSRRESASIEPLSACIKPLQSGASEQAVKLLQRQLKELGYYQGAMDGVYGSGTQGAVSQFQRDQNLDVDGVVGCNTQVKINQALQ